MTSAIEARGLSMRFGEHLALDDLDLAVRPGEILGVLGPNGAGKTTAIRILTTVLTPVAGSFSVAGIPGTRPDRIRARIGVLPESTGYPGRQTGEELLIYAGRLHGLGRADARTRARTLLDEFGLADRGGTLIGGYSRGMRQRLGLARTLVNEPAVVFLDEPTLGLDPAGQRQVLSMVDRIARERGMAVLLTTHLLDEVEAVCGRVMILNRGRLVADGPVAEVAGRAAAPRSARVRVPVERRSLALTVLAPATGVDAAEADPGRPDTVTMVLADGSANGGLRALAEAGIPVLSFELQGARLSDAFLAVTGDD